MTNFKMNFKKISFVVVIAVFTGFVAFLGIRIFLDKQEVMLRVPQITKQPYPSPSPKPTLPPIGQNSNLEDEINKLEPGGYPEDFSTLKQEATQF